jgi:hypothetical protein
MILLSLRSFFALSLWEAVSGPVQVKKGIVQWKVWAGQWKVCIVQWKASSV